MAVASSQPKASSRPGLFVQLLLALAVVITGSLNNILKQVAAKPLGNYTYMLSLTSAVINIPLYCGACWLFLKKGWIPRWQLDFVWKADVAFGLPAAAFFVIAALGDTLGDGLGMICTPYVAGPIHSLLANFTPIWIALLSVTILRSRYSLLQCLGMGSVLLAVAIGLLPTFESGSGGGTSPFFAAVLAGSCIFNAGSWVIKEMVFSRFEGWKASQSMDDHRGMHIFLVNAHISAFSLPLTLLCVPLNQVLGQMHGESIVSYVPHGVACMFGDCPGHSKGEDIAGIAVAVYMFFNITWNLCILLSVKISGALPTFIALKGIFPVSTVLFAYVDWPVLGRTHMNPVVWLAVALMIPAIAVYQYASDQQRKRKSSGGATCCWPLGKPKKPQIAEPMLANPCKFACPYKQLPCATDCAGTPCATSCLLLTHRDGIRDV